MSASKIIDLSFAAGEQQNLADLPFEVGMLNGEAPEDVRELDVSHANLAMLSTVPESPINDLLQFVTILRASNNTISTLRGLDAFASLEVLDLSHNSLRVIDAHAANLLKTLRQLRTADFSHNNMTLLDLDGSFGAPTPRSLGRSGGSGGAGFLMSPSNATGAGRLASSSQDGASGLTSLTAIDLSHNAFIELPDLRSAPFLQVLNISHNKLEAVTDVDVRLPLLSLHSLLMHANRVPSVSALVPLCALATTLKHIQVFGNPFTLTNGKANDGVDKTLWWRPFLLWLCPLLTTTDQTELTSSERRVATEALFREHGSLSRSALELMNPQHKDDLEAYLRRQSEAAEPPADALVVMRELQEEDQEDAAMPLKKECDGAFNALDDNEDEEEEDEEEEAYATDVVVPMSRMNTVREEGATRRAKGGENGGAGTKSSPLSYNVGSHDHSSSPSTAPTGAGTKSATRSSSRVVIVDPSSTDGILVTNHNRQSTKTVPIAAVVRALQQKTRSLEEVVAVLWRGDLARRTAAAVVIQRYMRGALARMHLSDDDAESCRFIRYQLQQAAAAMKAHPAAATSVGTVTGAASLPRGPSTCTAAAHGAGQASLDAIEAEGSSMEEVLISMRSLQEVMSSMWIDLEEYRAMADREQRRAAILIQRWYRGYCVRRDFGRVRHRRPSPSPSCTCAGETAALQKEVAELRHEVRELRELMVQTARQQRLAAYGDPEKAMDAIVRKHEDRVSEHRNVVKDLHQHGDSRSPSATPSITGGGDSASQERGLLHSRSRGETVDGNSAQHEIAEASSRSSNQSKIHVHRIPQQVSARLSPSGIRSPDLTSPSSKVRRPAKITKRRPEENSAHPFYPNDSTSTSTD